MADPGGIGDRGDGHPGVTQFGELADRFVEDRIVDCGVAGATWYFWG